MELFDLQPGSTIDVISVVKLQQHFMLLKLTDHAPKITNLFDETDLILFLTGLLFVEAEPLYLGDPMDDLERTLPSGTSTGIL